MYHVLVSSFINGLFVISPCPVLKKSYHQATNSVVTVCLNDILEDIHISAHSSDAKQYMGEIGCVMYVHLFNVAIPT